MERAEPPVTECVSFDVESYLYPEWELDETVTSLNGHGPSERTATTAELKFDEKVEIETGKQLVRLLAQERARDEVRARRRGELVIPEPRSLADLLAEPDDPVRYRVEGWWPREGRVMLAAQQKTGKTTLVGNLVRSLADSVPFLGCYPVEPISGSVVVIDNEMSPNMLRRWYRDIGVVNADRVVVWPLRGYGSSFNLVDPDVRAEWAERLRRLSASVLVLDCLNPALVSLGLSESSNDDTGRFLAAFDELLVEAGAEEALIVHHMGHDGERSRGASKLRGWPEVEWKYVRDREDDGPEVDTGTRYLSAYGRDVEVPESALEFDPTARRLSLVGGDRRQQRVSRDVDAVVEIVRRVPAYAINATGIKDQLGEMKAERKVEAIARAERDGLIHRKDGQRNAKLYALGPRPAPGAEDGSDATD